MTTLVQEGRLRLDDRTWTPDAFTALIAAAVAGSVVTTRRCAAARR
ncbi:hypothetical protein [Streptomyces sp. NPDC093105]